MHCKNCRKEIPDYSNYCLYCGQKLKEVELDKEEYPNSQIEILYENVMIESVFSKLRNPSQATYPKFNEDMIKIIKGFGSDYKVIETYVDATNGFGARQRIGVRIKIDNNLNYCGVAFKEFNSLMFGMYRK